MAKKRKLRQELSKFARKTEKPLELISGALGIYIGGKQYVDIPTRPGYVFVRLRNNMSELIQAHNQTVSPIYDLPVLVVWNHNRYEIYGRDSEQYGSYWDTSSSFLPKHGFQHEFDPDNNGGGDLVFVHGEQFYPMMTFPSGTDGANTVLIAPYRYFYQGLWRYTGNTGVGDLLALGPTGANNAKLLLVGVTSATGNPFIKQGDEFSEGITGAAALTQFVPTSLTPIDEIPGAIIRLVTGTETITWANIYDARQYMGILQAGSGTAGASTFLELNDTPNSYAGQADKLVVVNSAETALEFRTNTGSFGGGGGGQLGIYGQDEAVGLGTGTVLNVTGDNVSLSISGTVLTLAHTNPTGTPYSFLDLTDTPDSYSGQGGKLVAVNTGTTGLEFVSSTITQVNSTGIMAQDEGTPLGTGTVFNFRGDNIVATISGTVVDVYVTGSSGGSSIWFNVSDYGAIGNGIADDTTAVQTAINAANAVGGGVIWFPAGTYSCSPLTLYANISLKGVSMVASIIQARASGTLFTLASTVTWSVLGIWEDLWIDGNSTGTIGLDIIGGERLNMQNIKFSDFTSIALKLRAVLVSEFHNCIFLACAYGVTADIYTLSGAGYCQCNLINFVSCSIVANTSWGLHWLTSSQLNLYGCDISNNGTNGDATTGGIYFKSPQGASSDPFGLLLDGCWFEANYGKAEIWIDGNNRAGVTHTIRSTTFSPTINATYGIELDAPTHATTLTCNDIHIPTAHASGDFYANGTYATIILNNCNGTTAGTGIFIIEPTTDEIIQDVVGTMVTGNIETGISVTYDDTAGKLNFVTAGIGQYRQFVWATISGSWEFVSALVSGAYAPVLNLLDLE